MALKDEQCLSISAGDNITALLQCQRAAFLVQTYNDEAAILIRNGQQMRQRRGLKKATGKKSRTMGQPRQLKLAEKKIIFSETERQGKIIHSRWRRGCHHLSTIPVDNLVH
ncbi:hypothetical protein CBI35_01940 [Pantoea sp. AV62]|uniref:hypothetical protein n=1 Tax=Pantoea sp. AV62 TaxID=1990688 RepID=UPI000B7C879C|nr:hypothetical protein [Pantoea sp. AV62]OXM26628.1 hypothetical protein CBI35_01940 [Pantoea sp. AV62]